MSLEQLILLALIQGITEFLPISSSAHLILLPIFAGFEDQGTLMDVAVHVGTLFAVMLYFRKDVIRLFIGAGDAVLRKPTTDARLLWALVIATVPTVIVGGILYVNDWTDGLRSPAVIGWTTLIFGVLLYESDRVGMRYKTMKDMTLRGALFVGLMQVISLIPGTSRSGITMTAGRFLGYERSEAARFSMLLSIPTIGMLGLAATVELIRSGETMLQANALIAAGLAFISAYIAIWFLMSLVNRIGFLPFVIYRVVLGAGLLTWVYFF